MTLSPTTSTGSSPQVEEFIPGCFSMGGVEISRVIWEVRDQGLSKAVIIGGIPPFLLKTADNPEGVESACLTGF
jgi:non-heme chloroperoxidase